MESPVNHIYQSQFKCVIQLYIYIYIYTHTPINSHACVHLPSESDLASDSSLIIILLTW